VWNHDAIVIQTRSYFGGTRDDGRWTEHEETWFLVSRDRLKISMSETGRDMNVSLMDVLYARG
jgi:hypothetical protein